MNTLDDLTTALDQYSQRDTPRGADEVWAAAATGPMGPGTDAGATPNVPRRQSRRPFVLAAAAVLLVLVATVAVVRNQTNEVGVITTPTPDPSVMPPSSVEPAALAPVLVPGGRIFDVFVGFGRIWVGSADQDETGASLARLRSFDVATSELVTDVPIAGYAFQMAATDQHLWLRALSGAGAAVPRGPAGDSDNAIYRVDPVSGQPRLMRSLTGTGNLATSGSRIAAADHTHVEILDEEGNEVGRATIDEVVGVGGAGATPSMTVLAFGPPDEDGEPSALYAVHTRRNELLELDPASGRHVVTRVIEDGPEQLAPSLAVSDGFVWVAGNTTAYGTSVPLMVASPTDRRIVTDGIIGTIESIDPTGGDPRIAVLAGGETIVAGDDADPVVTSASGILVMLDDRPWVARWDEDPMQGPVVVSFVAIRTDESMPTTAVEMPTSVPAPPSTSTETGWPTFMVSAAGPLVDGETALLIGDELPPGPAMVSLCLNDEPAVSNPCRSAFTPGPEQLVQVGDNGELRFPWVAQRSLYDGRWHDCAEERCVLRLFGMNAAGGRDVTNVLGETSLTFSADDPPIRPSIRVVDEEPLTVGMTGRIVGEHFPANAKGITVGLCQTGGRDQTCRYAVYFNQMADANGRVDLPFTIPSGTITMPALDPSDEEVIDCTAAPGTCSFAIFPDDSSVEPYATVPIDLRP